MAEACVCGGGQSKMDTFKSVEQYREAVLGSTDMWFVIFTDGVYAS